MSLPAQIEMFDYIHPKLRPYRSELGYQDLQGNEYPIGSPVARQQAESHFKSKDKSSIKQAS